VAPIGAGQAQVRHAFAVEVGELVIAQTDFHQPAIIDLPGVFQILGMLGSAD